MMEPTMCSDGLAPEQISFLFKTVFYQHWMILINTGYCIQCDCVKVVNCPSFHITFKDNPQHTVF